MAPAPTRPARAWRDYLYLTGAALQVLAAAIVTPIVTRTLGPAQFGRMASGMVLMQVIFAVQCLGLSVGIQRVHAEGPEGEHHVRSLLSLALILAVVITLGLLLSAPLWSQVLGFGHQLRAVQYSIVWAGLAGATAVFTARFQSQNRAAIYIVVSIIQGVVTQVMALTALFVLQRSASTYLGGMMVGQTVALAVCLVASPPAARGLLQFRRNKALLAFTLPLVPNQLATFVLESSDRFVVQSRLGPAAVGRYSISYNLGILGATLLSVLNTVWLPPIFAAPEGPERIEVLARTRDQLLRMTLPTMLGIALGAPAVLLVWAPATFDPAGLRTVTTLIALSSMAVLVFTSEYRVLVTASRTRTVGYATGLCAVANVALNFALVPILGIDGSALATLVAYSGLALVAHLCSRRVTRLPPISGRLRLWALAVTGATFASALIPAGGAFFGVRLALGSLCAVALLASFRGPDRPHRVDGSAGPLNAA